MSDISRAPLGVYSVMGGAVFSFALPWLPDALSKRVRGALAQDVVSKHGISLSLQARQILAAPGASTASRTIAQQALRLGATRMIARMTPLVNLVPPVLGFVSTFALGHLLDRYLREHRTDSAIRMDDAEARRVRAAIDHAVKRVLWSRSTASKPRLATNDEQRDTVTQVVDAMIVGVANIPTWLAARLEAGFDDAMREA